MKSVFYVKSQQYSGLGSVKMSIIFNNLRPQIRPQQKSILAFRNTSAAQHAPKKNFSVQL
jgi:hypothetical protein